MLLTGCTIRARVAFVLAIAEVVRVSIETHEIVAERIRSALDLAWRWEQSGDVSGNALSRTVESENDDNLGVDSCLAPDAQKSAWVVITSALYYTSWQAYMAAGNRKGMSETVNEVDEDVIDQVVNYARLVPGFDVSLIERLAQYCVDHYQTADPSVMGEPVARDLMLQVATSAG
jgi:hypothetical protein